MPFQVFPYYITLILCHLFIYFLFHKITQLLLALLQVEFEQRGEQCKPPSLPPSTSLYHRDELTCGSQHSLASLALTVILALAAAVVRWPWHPASYCIYWCNVLIQAHSRVMVWVGLKNICWKQTEESPTSSHMREICKKTKSPALRCFIGMSHVCEA